MRRDQPRGLIDRSLSKLLTMDFRDCGSFRSLETRDYRIRNSGENALTGPRNSAIFVRYRNVIYVSVLCRSNRGFIARLKIHESSTNERKFYAYSCITHRPVGNSMDRVYHSFHYYIYYWFCLVRDGKTRKSR